MNKRTTPLLQVYLLITLCMPALHAMNWQSYYQLIMNSPLGKFSFYTTALGAAVVGGDSLLYNLTRPEYEFSKKQNNEPSNKLPIVYHERYSVTMGSFLDSKLQKLHPFDLQKYKRIYTYLTDIVGLRADQFYRPAHKVSDNDLKIVHSEKYLRSLRWSYNVMLAVEAPVLLPNWLLQWRLLDPMRYATQGTVDAMYLALKHGWAINLSGGYHHASREKGQGFCVFGDIQLAAEKFWQIDGHKNKHVLIVDLDAHRGNGHEHYFKESYESTDRKVSIFDFYNNRIYPGNRDQSENCIDKAIKSNENNYSKIIDAQYMQKLTEQLPQFIKKLSDNNKKPSLIIYNAGTDVFEEDQLGLMGITKNGIINRDAFVFKQAEQNGIPVVMVLSGGYTKESAEIVSESIENILRIKKVHPKPLTSKTSFSEIKAQRLERNHSLIQH